MYAKILVAVDESDTSLNALKQAIELARKLSATLRMVHVVDMSWLPIGPEVAINTTALSEARRGVGEKIMAAARVSGYGLSGVPARPSVVSICWTRLRASKAIPAAWQPGRVVSSGASSTALFPPINPPRREFHSLGF